MIAVVATADGVLVVDVEQEILLRPGAELPETDAPSVELPRVVATARAGATVVAVVDRHPPLAISRDGGATWTEAGGGLPVGFAVTVAEATPTGCFTRGATGSISRSTAACSGARWRSNCRTSPRSPGSTEAKH